MTLTQLGKNIEQLRKFKNLTYYQINKDIGVRQDQIQMIENNSGAYTAQTLIKLLDYLGIELIHHIDLSKLPERQSLKCY